METPSQTLGIVGEELAAQYLRAQGYKLLIRNYENALGELDLIAKDKGVLVFVEIKSRSSAALGSGFESITFKKRRQITRCALAYLKRYCIADVPCRFDVVSILFENEKHPVIELIKDAFPAEE